MEERLKDYLNSRVNVHYGGSAVGYNDVGVLAYLDETWLELVKEKGERLLIPIIAVRMIKLMEPGKLNSDAATLLRPTDFGEKK